MTEAEWQSCAEPEKMLEWLRHAGKATERKLRLVACACARRVWHLLPDKRSTEAIEVAEGFADGMVSTAVLRAASVAAPEYVDEFGRVSCAHWAAIATISDPAPENEVFGGHWRAWRVGGAYAAAVVTADYVCRATATSGPGAAELPPRYELAIQAALVRDIFGNPFRAVTFDPTWRTPIVLALGQRAYDERRLPTGTLDSVLLAVLGDALEQGGCANREILAHLRSPGPHVRGCFAMDLVTGRV